MKRVVLLLSLIAPVLLYVVGGLFFFVSGFYVDSEAPPTSPRRVFGALIGFLPGFFLAGLALVLSLRAMARSRHAGWFAVLLAWPVVPIAAAVLMVTGTLGPSSSWWLAALFVPLATLIYGIIGPGPGLAPVTDARVRNISGITGQPRAPTPPSPRGPFLAFVGVLALMTLLGFATLIRGAPPFFPLPAATPTIGPSVLSVRMGDSPANCATGVYPTVTITNTAQQTVAWSARVNDAGVAVMPAGGSLDVGASATVIISGRATTPTFFTIFFTAKGSQSVAKIACISG